MQRVASDDVLVTRRRRLLIPAVSVLVAAAAALALYAGYQRVAPLIGSGCDAGSGSQVVSLSTGQAGIAATIAGVAQRDALPAHAVTVAYAAAMQESKLQDLPYGDRDSVGIFQQRPSQGWGTPAELEDPVYASAKFFSALTSIPGYQQMPVYQAAQAVQHSADGYAYQQYQPMATRMATAFTGAQAHAVWCWYPQKITGTVHLGAVTEMLSRTFGSGPARVTPDPRMSLRVHSAGEGWAVAAWLVSHAQQDGIRSVGYASYMWSASDGERGWVRSVSGTKPGSVQLG